MGQALSRKRFTFTPATSSPNGEIPTAKTEVNGTARKDKGENVVVLETSELVTKTANTETTSPTPDTTFTSDVVDTTITSDVVDTTASPDVTSSTVTTEETPSPTKKEKRKIRKLFTFSLKRSRPGSGRKKSKKENGATSQTSSPDTTKEDTRQSLFLEEFEIPECHDTDAVDLSDPEESVNISKTIDPENTSTPKKDESLKKNKKGSKSPKSSKKIKKTKSKSEKKKKNEEAKAEKKREKEEKAKREKEQKDSLKKKKELEKGNGTVLIIEESVEPLQVETSESQPASPDVTSKDAEVVDGKQTIEDEIKVDVSETQETSPPSSPRSDDDGTPKRVALGPRLKTSILRKVSSGKESESSRVTLTRPKTVEMPNPPPRKHRKRPLSQNADTSAASITDSSLSTLEQSSIMNESSIAEQLTEYVAKDSSSITENKEETTETVASDQDEADKSLSTEIAEAIDALEHPVIKEVSKDVESDVDNKAPLEIEIILPVANDSVASELDVNKEKDIVVESPSASLEEEYTAVEKTEDNNTEKDEQNRESNQEVETVITAQIVEKEQAEIPVSVDVSTGSENQETNSDVVSAATIDLVMSSRVTDEASSKETQNNEGQMEEEIRAIAKAHTALVVSGAMETLKSEYTQEDRDDKETENSGREPVNNEDFDADSSSLSQEVIAVNKYSIETGETCTVITVGQKSEIDEIKTVDKGLEEPLENSNTGSGDSTEVTKPCETDNTSRESAEIISSVASVTVSCATDSSVVSVENSDSTLVSEAKEEAEVNESAKDIADSNDGAIKSSDISVVCVENSSIEHDAKFCAETSCTDNDGGLSSVSQSESKDNETVTFNDSERVTCNDNDKHVTCEQLDESGEERQLVTETVTIFQTRLVTNVSPVEETNNNKILSSDIKHKDNLGDDTTFKSEARVVLEGGNNFGVE